MVFTHGEGWVIVVGFTHGEHWVIVVGSIHGWSWWAPSMENLG